MEEITEEAAELVARVAALDVGKASLVACVRVPICSARTAGTPLGMPMRSDPGRSSPASTAQSCCRHAALKIKKA